MSQEFELDPRIHLLLQFSQTMLSAPGSTRYSPPCAKP